MLGLFRLIEELFSCWPLGRFDIVYTHRHLLLAKVPAQAELEVGGCGVGDPTPLPSPEEGRS